MNEDRWIQVSLESHEMGRKVRAGIALSYRMHQWAMTVLRGHWMEQMQVLTVNEMQPMMTYWLREKGEEETVQRYALDIALSRTILHFNNNLETVGAPEDDENGDPLISVRIPQDVPKSEWDKLDIQSRTVWKRYVEDYGRITTHYGTIFLEGDWTDGMRGYAADLKVGLDALPHIWNSVTLKEGVIVDNAANEDEEYWLMRFNFFKPDSVAAKKRTKKGKMYVSD